MDRKCPAGNNTNDKERIVADKEKAMLKIMKVLKSPMVATCKPMRDDALTLATEHGITVEELIDFAYKIAMNI